jgi:hypothetical protein
MAYVDTAALVLIGIADAKVPNDERVILQVPELVDLGEYGLVVGLKAKDGRVYPMNDNVFWFPKIVVGGQSYVFVYTGVGQTERTTVDGTGEDALVLHWGRPTTIFNVPQLVPVLVRRDVLAIGRHI